MAAVSARRRAFGTLTIAGFATLVVMPAPAAAAGADGVIALGNTVLTGLTVDLDDDGAREVVVLHAVDSETRVELEVWASDGTAWQVVGRRDVQRYAADGGLVGAEAPRDGLGLIVADDGGRERIYVAVTGDATESQGCCLTLSEVQLGPTGLELSIAPRQLGITSGLAALDVDGDGRDEFLSYRMPTWTPEGEPVLEDLTYRLLRRVDDENWTERPLTVPAEAQPAWPGNFADTDGVPGEDVVIFGGETGMDLYRFVDDGAGGLELEAGPVQSADTPGGAWIAGAADGRLVLYDGNELMVGAWPRGGSLSVTERVHAASSQPVVVGSGPAARIIVGQAVSYFPVTNAGPVYDLDLRPVGEIDRPAASEALAHALEAHVEVLDGTVAMPFPYFGPVPGGSASGDDVWLLSGTSVRIGPDGTIEYAEVSSMAGLTPLGFAGPADSWMLVADGYAHASRTDLVLFAGLAAQPIRLVPLAELMRAEPDSELSVTLIDAVQTGEDTIAARRRFTLELEAIDGAKVILLATGSSQGPRIAQDGKASFDVSPRRGSDGNHELRMTVVVVDATGRLSVDSWDVSFILEPPEVTAAAQVEAFAFTATVAGTATVGTTVTVDGRPVETDRDGRFTTTVDAPIWPRPVVVAADDLHAGADFLPNGIGGGVDYREWPWPVIIGLVTVVGGAVMYLRAPRDAAARAPSPAGGSLAGDGRLEELDGDWP